jgi:hypothetical protein
MRLLKFAMGVETAAGLGNGDLITATSDFRR